MSIRLNDEELAAMEGLPHIHRCLYIFGIRQYMDYETGITGIKRGISWQSLREELYVEPHQGRIGSGSPSKDQVIRAAEFLEKNGVIKNMSEGKRLIFKCVLATQDKSAQNKPATNPLRQPATQADTFETNNDVGFNNNPTTKPAIPKIAKPATPPVSGNTTTNTIGEWMSFFEKRGFGMQLANANVNGLCIYLAQEGVTEEEVEHVMMAVNARSTDKRITTPAYYTDAIKRFIEAKRNPTVITSGQQTKRGNDYADDKRTRQQRRVEIDRELEEDYARAMSRLNS